MAQATVEFFWDAASPYSYLASTRIEALAQRAGARLEWRPFLLGGVFQGSDNRMPAAVPAKGRHMFRDLALWARYYGVPLRRPEPFPVSTVLAQRAGIAAAAHGKAAAYALAAMRLHWGEGRDLSKPEVVAAAAEAAGLDAAALLQAAQEQPVKDQLRANTEEAVKRGAFGAPSFFVGEELFWGNDRLPLLEEYLCGRLAP